MDTFETILLYKVLLRKEQRECDRIQSLLADLQTKWHREEFIKWKENAHDAQPKTGN